MPFLADVYSYFYISVMSKPATIVIFALLVAAVFFITCKKEYSYEGGNGGVVTPPPPIPTAAEYTLTGSPNDCEAPSIYGEYFAGRQFTSSNTIQINVNVTVAGPWSITTDTLNGVYFSASGTFTHTGNQSVILNGNGRPDQPRNFHFSILAVGSSCTFTLPVINSGALATYVIESGSGTATPCNFMPQGDYTSHSTLGPANSVSIRVYVTNPGNFTIATNMVNGIQFYYTGAFTMTGSQDVFLAGSGTPLTAGTYTFTPEIVGPHPLGGEFCSFTIDVQ
jgi:hypothetical protein